MHERLAGRSIGIALTPRGCEQARNTAEYLTRLPVNRIITSPQQRARETAAILAESLQTPIETHPAFDELDFGEWTGLKFADLADRSDWKTFNSLRSVTKAPGGESLQEAQTRAIRGVLNFHSSSKGSVFAIVTHADIIRSVIAYFTGAALDLFLRFVVDPASVSIVQIADTTVQIACLNRTD